jgi:tetratricopeptide (TPR) repeat protein
MDEMLGTHHHAVVDLLLDRLDTVQAGERAARVVVLEGASGVGKTRIIQEFYARLAARQTAPAYWPPLAPHDPTDEPSPAPDKPLRTSLLRPSTNPATRGHRADPLPDRKLLGPPVEGFVWPAGSTPDFLWWAVSCDQLQSGAAVDATLQYEEAMRAHLVPLALARAQQDGAWRNASRAVRENIATELRELASEGVMEAAGRALEAIGAPVPGLGWLVSKTAQSFTWARTRRQQQTLQRTGGLLADATTDQPDRLAVLDEALRQVLAPGLPAVVAVEDLHLMDTHLGDLLDRLAAHRPDTPVLVVATAWPEGRERPAYDAWLSRAGTGVEVVGVDGLATADMVTLVRREAPATDDATAARLARRFDNPLALRIVLSLDRFRRRIDETGALRLDDDDLAHFPRTLEQAYRARWAELPDDVRAALLLAAASMGRDPSNGEPHNSFIADVVVGGAVAAGLASHDDGAALAVALDEGVTPLAWLTRQDAGLAFREGLLIETALADLEDHLAPGDVTAFRDAVGQRLCDWVDHERGPSALLAPAGLPLLTASWLHHLALADGSLTSSSHPASSNHTSTSHPASSSHTSTNQASVAAARLALARARAAGFRFDDAVALLTDHAVLEALDVPPADALILRGVVATWHAEIGDLDHAIAEGEAVLPALTATLGPDHPSTLIAQANLAHHIGLTGATAQAGHRYEGLIVASTRALGPDAEPTLVARAQHAHYLAASGDVAAARDALEVLLTDRLRVSGPDHEHTLGARHQLANMRGRLGDVAGALRETRALLADRTRVDGPDHPATLQCRLAVSGLLGELGDLTQALAEGRSVLADLTRVHGPVHPLVFNARHQLAHHLGQTGDYEGAVTAFEHLLADCSDALGPEHPDTLLARSQWAAFLGYAGRTSEALEEYRSLLPVRARVSGEDAPETLTVRHQIASHLAELGGAEEALRAARSLQPDFERVFGATHPAALHGRHQIAYYLSLLGRDDEARDAVDSLLVDRARVLGPDHPDTLLTRHQVAALLTRAGHASEAVTAHEALLADLERVLGPDHPMTLTTRFELGAALAADGQEARSLTLGREVAAARARVLGPAHPETLLTREYVASFAAQIGAHDDAAAEYRALLTAQEGLWGADDEHTRATRASLAGVLGSLKRYADAHEEFERLHASESRTLPEDHPGAVRTVALLGFYRALAGDGSGGLAVLQDALPTALRVLGEDSDWVTDIRTWIAALESR